MLLLSFTSFGQNKKTLDDKIHVEIKKLSQEGDLYVENAAYQNALAKYWKAYNLIPDPKTDWEATLWLLAAIGDTNFLNMDFKAGVDNLTSAMHCPNGIGNPFLHLRLGQCQYEIGKLEKAADELTRAYGIAGKEIFESEDPKYFKFLKTKIKMD